MIRRLLASIFPPSHVKRLVGVDHLGNKYYEMEKADGKKKRFLERTDDIRPEDYEQGMIPNQWEAWMRGRTDTPPTVMELLAREKSEKLIAIKGKEIRAKDDEAQKKAYEDGLIARVTAPPENSDLSSKQVGHASSHFYGPKDESPEPSTVSGDFQPGAWKPKASKSNNGVENKEDGHFKPENWTPPKTTS